MANPGIPFEVAEHAFKLVEEHGNPTAAALASGIPRSTIQHRISIYERVKTPTNPLIARIRSCYHPAAEALNYSHPYVAVLFTDAHFWPGQNSPAFAILLKIMEHLEAEVIVDLGDAFDGARISGFPDASWSDLQRPSVREELVANIEAYNLIKAAAGTAEFFRIPGNHGKRLEAFLVNSAPHLAEETHTKLEDYFTECRWSDSVVLNDTLVCMHDYKSGLHAAHDNALNSGKSFATGHSHQLKVYPVDDLNGRRYGMECGTLADIYGPQFSYMGHRPRTWAAGFMIVTIDGAKVHPEMVYVDPDGSARWRGKVWKE